MNPDDAKAQLVFDTCQDKGTFTQLRLGNDPGPDSIKRLRIALRVLWRHWKSRHALPYEIAHSASIILHFRREATENLRIARPQIWQSRIRFELDDLAQGAFDLLAGSAAESWTIGRTDLGEREPN